MGKKHVCNAEDVGLIPGSERSPRGGHGNPLQDSCLENPMDRGEWQATVHRVAKNQTQLKCLSTQQHSKTTEMLQQKGKTNKIRPWKKRTKHQIPQGCWLLDLIKVGKVGMEK